MKIVSTSYVASPEFTDPGEWLRRISFYTGILEELAKQHEVLSIERINYEGYLDQAGVRYLFLKHDSTIIRFPWRMHRIIKKFRADVVLVNGLNFPFQLMQLKAKQYRAKIICIHRADKPLKGFKRLLQKATDRYIDAYLFSSVELAGSWIENGNIDSRKIREVMHASSHFYPENVITRENLIMTGSPVFLWVGRLDVNKDPVTVIKAFIRFSKAQPGASLYMIYQTEELLSKVKHLLNADTQTAKSVYLVGKIAHNDLQQWYNAADFFISGSHYEGGGIAVCEAMSCGCIPVLTSIPSFRMMIANGECGLLYNPGNEEELLALLLKTRDVDLSTLKEKVLAHFNQELSFNAIARKIENIIRNEL